MHNNKNKNQAQQNFLLHVQCVTLLKHISKMFLAKTANKINPITLKVPMKLPVHDTLSKDTLSKKTTLKCFSIGTSHPTTFQFYPKWKMMVFRCPNS